MPVPDDFGQSAQCLLLHTLANLCIVSDVVPEIERLQFGRPHHRILFFAHAAPGITVGELLRVMRVSHQNLRGPLKRLIGEGYIESRPGERDRRHKQNYLTPKGVELIAELTAVQTRRIEKARASAGAKAFEGFLKFHAHLIDAEDLAWIALTRRAR